MEDRAVTLMLRYKDSEGTWRRSPAARGANGRIKPGHVMVGGKMVGVEEGRYQLRMYEDRRVVFVNVGKNAAMAEAQRVRMEKRATAKVVAADAGLKLVEEEQRKTLKATAAAYIADAIGRAANEAAEQARLVTTEFMAVVRKRKKEYIDEITRNDIFAFHAALRKRGCEPRTVANKHARMASWLKFAGVDKGLEKNDPTRVIPPEPKYEDTLPTIYESDQISTLLGNADQYQTICILLALKCGLRDQELRHLEFADINRKEGTLRVQGKPRWGFSVKTWEQRDIPIPDDLLNVLSAWQKEREGETLVLATKNQLPPSKLLRSLKRLAHRSGLNCGQCDSCKALNECEEFTLHRFRRTYLTTLLRNGIDLRTVQAYAGHKDIASTMRYLRPATGTEAKAKLNAVKW